MAEKRTINIDINNNADEAAKDFENFAKATNVANDSVEGLNKTFEEVYGELQPLTTRMGEAEDRLYELSLAGDTASKEYQELLKSVGNYRKVQIQTDLAVDQAAQTMSQKLGGALTGAASGFAAVQGVMALTGSESEALEESLLKVQGAMAFQQGVQGVLDYSKSVGLASKATALWNAILNLNPLALIATAIIGIVAYLVTFTDALDSAIQMFKDLGDAIGITNFKEEELAEERKNRNIEEIARLNELKRVRDIAFQERQKQFDREIALLEAEGKSSFKLRQQKLQDLLAIQKQKASDLKSDVSNANARLFMATSDIERQLAETQLTKYKEFLTEINSEIAETENQLKINVLNNNEEKIESYNSYADSRLAIARRIEDLENEIREEGIVKDLEASRLRFEREIEDVRSDETIKAKEKKRLIELYLFQQQEAENDIRNEFRQKELEAEKEFGVESINIAELTANKEVETTFNKYAAMGELSLQYYQDEEDLRKRNKQFAIDSAFETLDLISNITELFGKKGEKQAKRAFEVQKAAQIATTLGTTYLSATQAYASQFLPLPDPSSPVRGGIAAGLAVASGLANVAKIASQKFEGGGATGGTSVSGSVPDAPSAPQFNVVGDSGVNQLAQLQQQPTQAYVVSGEVTTAQALDRNRVQNATL